MCAARATLNCSGCDGAAVVTQGVVALDIPRHLNTTLDHLVWGEKGE